MKKLLAFTIVALMAGSALAAPGMGVFFSNTEFTAENTNVNMTAAPFNAYLVVIGADGIEQLAAYDVGIQIDNAGVFVLGVSGSNGWTNFGNNTNHLCGFGADGAPPLPVVNGSAVLSTLNMLYSGTDPVEIKLGPSSLSVPLHGHPVIVDAAFPDDPVECGVTTGVHIAQEFQTVATLHNADNGLVATEAQSLSHIKALFD